MRRLALAMVVVLVGVWGCEQAAGPSKEKQAVDYRNRGLAYDEKGEHDKAVADCDMAIILDPTNARAYALRGIAYWEKGEEAKARADFAKAKKLQQDEDIHEMPDD